MPRRLASAAALGALAALLHGCAPSSSADARRGPADAAGGPDRSLAVARVDTAWPAPRRPRLTIVFDRTVVRPARAWRPVVRTVPERVERHEWPNDSTLVVELVNDLLPGDRVMVVVTGALRARDGTTLGAALRIPVRVPGMRILDAIAEGPGIIAPNGRLSISTFGDTDTAALLRAIGLVLDGDCSVAGARPRRVPLRLVAARPLARRDTWRFGLHTREAMAAARRDESSPLVGLELEATAPLPGGCGVTLDASAARDVAAPPTHFRVPPPPTPRLACGDGRDCPEGPIVVAFGVPVRGGEVARHVRVAGFSTAVVGDTSGARDAWALDAVLRPRTAYVVTVDSALVDIHDRPVGRTVVDTVRSTGYPPHLEYQSGSVVLLPGAEDELAVRHVNVDSVIVVVRALPDSIAARALRGEWMYRGTLAEAMRGAPATRMALGGPRDEPRVTRLPIAGGPGPRAVQLLLPRQADSAQHLTAPIALVQRSRLAVQAKVASGEAWAWVLDARSGRPVAGALLTRYDDAGRALGSARTDDRGIARVGGGEASLGERGYGVPGWLTAEHDGDRMLVAPAPWSGALERAVGVHGIASEPFAASLVTERGIYRPGEPVYAHLVLREGWLGALRAPRPGGAVRLVANDDHGAAVAETTVVLSAFGTAAVRLPAGAAASVGAFGLEAERRDARGRWITAAYATYDVAEYRAPEFLLAVAARDTQAVGGDTTTVALTGRYLYGAPFAGAPLAWRTAVRHLAPSELRIPGTEGWAVGTSTAWRFEPGAREDSALASSSDGVAALDDSGRATIALRLPRSSIGAPLKLTLEASGEDVNRQRVAGRQDVVVHPAILYAAARDTGGWFWRGGAPRRIDVVAVTLAGRRVAGRRVTGVLERRRWRARGEDEISDGWAVDTVGSCAVVTAAEPVPCTVTPPGAGSYTLRLAVADDAGRVAATTLSRWASGEGVIDWWGATPHRLHLVADRDEYEPGDTAEVLVSAPEPLEGWLAIEREGVLDERRLRLAAGTTTLRVPIEARFAPNVHLTVLAIRPPGVAPATDDAPPARAGAVALRVRTVAQRLRLVVEPLAREHRPGDSTKVRVLVRDAAGHPDRADVTLWAVDEGVLALTEEELPRIVDAIYRPRGLGVLPTSTLLDLAADPPPLRDFGRYGSRVRIRGSASIATARVAPARAGGYVRQARAEAQALVVDESVVGAAFDSGGADDDEVRRRFLSTAFFLSGATTDASGAAVLEARLPDNLTTFRVVAIAVSAGDRYGAASAPLLVTKPLVLRPALPRFVRPGDAFLAGGVVARRGGGAAGASVSAAAAGALRLVGESTRGATTLGPRGAEVRFAWRAGEGDSARVTLHASGGGERDAVEVGLPVRERVRARRHVVSGILEGSATHEIVLPEGVDLARSVVRLDVGTSALALVAGFARDLRVYPWECTEQVASAALPLVALLRAQQTSGARFVSDGTREEIERAVRVIAGRQGHDGAIGLWSAGDWSTPRLTAHAGRLLLDAREAGIAVDQRTLRRLGDYLERTTDRDRPVRAVRDPWYGGEDSPAERLAAAELLRRLGRDTAPIERALLAAADSLGWEERAILARLRAARGDRRGARRLLAPLLAAIVERDGAIRLPDSVGRRDYFRSRVRPVALLLEALLQTEPRHRLVGPLVELVVRRGASGRADVWNTHDYASAVRALTRLEGRLGTPEAAVQARLGRTDLSLVARRGPPSDSALALADLGVAAGGAVRIPVRLTSRAGARVFYHLTVTEQPLRQPASAQSNGIAIERWYERAADGRRVEGAVEGELVRIRIRVHLEEPGEFVVVDDPLPAGLEAVDAALRTSERLTIDDTESAEDDESAHWGRWYGWSHSEVHDDRVVFFARYADEGAHELTYVARATTSGRFELPATHAEAMYEPETSGDGGGGAFEVGVRR